MKMANENGYSVIRVLQQSVMTDEGLMDKIMNIMNGPEAAETMRKELGYEGTIIGITGNALPDDIKKFIDAGANVGYSSVYFLSHFPNCRVIAIEPDGDNFASLQKNLAPYGERAQALKCGIWSKSAQLAIEDTTYRDGRDWTRQVRECEDGESGDIRAVTVGELLHQSGRHKLSLLKMDIEGAEAVVFADPSCQQWLPQTEAIAIELHDDSGFGPASNLFHAAIREQHYQISYSGELTICLRGDQAHG
jgi:FkbM family methyltransferase